MKTIDYELLEKKIGYTFKDKSLMKTALTHKTFAFEASTPLEYSERLEFFGDSILGFIVAEQLYISNKYFSEGELTRRRSSQVNNNFWLANLNEANPGSFEFELKNTSTLFTYNIVGNQLRFNLVINLINPCSLNRIIFD